MVERLEDSLIQYPRYRVRELENQVKHERTKSHELQEEVLMMKKLFGEFRNFSE